MKDNKMIYEKIENKMIPTEPINIFNNNKLIATINLGDDGMTLFIDFHNGEKRGYSLDSSDHKM